MKFCFQFVEDKLVFFGPSCTLLFYIAFCSLEETSDPQHLKQIKVKNISETWFSYKSFRQKVISVEFHGYVPSFAEELRQNLIFSQDCVTSTRVWYNLFAYLNFSTPTLSLHFYDHFTLTYSPCITFFVPNLTVSCAASLYLILLQRTHSFGRIHSLYPLNPLQHTLVSSHPLSRPTQPSPARRVWRRARPPQQRESRRLRAVPVWGDRGGPAVPHLTPGDPPPGRQWVVTLFSVITLSSLPKL